MQKGGGGEGESNFIETQLHGFAIMSKIFSIELGLFWQGKLTRFSKVEFLRFAHDFNEKFEYL